MFSTRILAERIVELEQRLQAIFSENQSDSQNGSSSSTVISPSQMLLKGYISSTVDQDKPKTEQQAQHNNVKHEDDSGTASSNESKCTSRDMGDNFSSESNKSIASSEYGAPYNGSSDTSSEYPDHNDDIDESQIGTLTDLPPELASMVQEALKQLNESEDAASTASGIQREN